MAVLLLEAVGKLDLHHAALTEFGLDAVAALQGCVQADDGVGHQYSALLRNPPLDDTRPSNDSAFLLRTRMLAAIAPRKLIPPAANYC